MIKKTQSIPVNTMADNIGAGISIGKISLDKASLNNFGDAKEAHREDRHSFYLLQKGKVHIEIDFKKTIIKSPSVTYMHPNQVHRIIDIENAIIGCWAMNNENLHPEYLKLLEDITPAKPLILEEETFCIISEAMSLCIKISERKNDRLYHSLLKDCCNALVALVISQYLELSKTPAHLSRFDMVAKAFREILETDFTTAKRPGDYSQKLHISTSYLNECLKNTTGYSVSHQIHQRIILEAKRLLYHSDESVKEIAAKLGFDDYPYFSKLFTKVAGMTPLTFRRKNRD